MNSFSLLWLMCTRPSAAFGVLREQRRVLFPLIGNVVVSALFIYLFYSWIDFEWFKQAQFGNSPQFLRLTTEQREDAIRHMTRNSLMWGGMAGGAVFTVLWLMVQALYQRWVGHLFGVRYTWGQWLAFSAWVALPPVLLGYLISGLMLLMAGHGAQYTLEALKPLSLNELFFHVTTEGPRKVLASFDLVTVWALVLGAIGTKVWSERSWLFCIAFSSAPLVVFYAIMLWVASR